MLNKQQIKLVQTALRAAGLRGKGFEGRYRLLLRQYRQPDGSPATSCKQINGSQLEDLLAICEAHGFRQPGKAADHFRKQASRHGTYASYAQRAAIYNLAGDLGWADAQISGFIKRMTKGRARNISMLTVREAYNIIEGLKAIVGRENGRQYSNLHEIQEDHEVTDGKANQI